MPRDSPRTIRDIAHLYLSRAQPPRAEALRLIVAGVTPDVVPGFHAANLALAAAASGASVRVIEASGLPVSSGCFLGLDPRCWAVEGQSPGAAVSAFARVSFVRGAGRSGGDEVPSATGAALEIVHAPPWDAGVEHVMCVESLPGPRLLLYVAESDSPRPWLEWRGVANLAARVIFVARPGVVPEDGACAGVITRWRIALTDLLPAVLRDPGSRLARQYRDAIAVLLAGTHTSSSRSHRHATSRLESL